VSHTEVGDDIVFLLVDYDEEVSIISLGGTNKMGWG
jgi:hypothetical protein